MDKQKLIDYCKNRTIKSGHDFWIEIHYINNHWSAGIVTREIHSDISIVQTAIDSNVILQTSAYLKTNAIGKLVDLIEKIND